MRNLQLISLFLFKSRKDKATIREVSNVNASFALKTVNSVSEFDK